MKYYTNTQLMKATKLVGTEYLHTCILSKFHTPINHLKLAICLGMVCSRKVKWCPLQLEEFLPWITSEYCISISYNSVGQSMQLVSIVQEGLNYSFGRQYKDEID